MWSAGRRAASLIIENQRLPWSLRPGAPDYIAILEWCRIDWNEILGSGVVRRVTAQLLERTDPIGVREKPHLQLLRGCGEMLGGNVDAARQLLAEALAGLPSAEVYARAQAEALLGRTLESSGRFHEAVMHYQQAMEKAPGVFRSMALAIPCRIASSADPEARKAAALLAASPRLVNARQGFDLRIQSSGSQLSAVLLGPDGTVLSEARVPLGKDPVEAARKLSSEFHRKAFSPKVDLSQSDIASLDGSNLTGDQVRDNIRDVFFPAKEGRSVTVPGPTMR